MGDEDDGLLALFVDLQQLVLQHLAGHRVERGKGLVEQDHIRVVGQHSGDGDALAHAARERIGVLVLKALEADHLDKAACHLQALGLGNALHLQAEGDVVYHREPGEKRVLLEHHAAVRIDLVDLAAVDDDAPGRGLVKTGDEVEQGGFAAARGAQQHDEFALFNLQIDAIERLEITVVLGNALHRNHGAFVLLVHCFHLSTQFSM